jgi:predicted DNA binding CopG/RHH family protein
LQKWEKEILKEQSKNTRTERLVIRVSKGFLEQIKQKAAENEMSVSSYVRFIIKNHINKKGL